MKRQEFTFEDGQGELHIEVHTNPMGQETGIRRQMNRYFTEVFQKKISVQIENTEIWTMEPTDHLLFLILHAFKHFMAGGLGIRQALDICLFCKRYQEEINWEYISDSLENVEGEKFFTDMLYIGNKYLGFDFKIHRERNCPDDLLEDMLTGGVFGNTTQTERTACSMTFAAVDSREKYSTASAVVRAIFPTMRFMRARNPELVEKPWLLPILWMKRWRRFIRYNKENGGGLARESIRTSQKRIELLKKYGLI